jgi:glycosyltransferase involved in cell wall biosynthesis
MGDVSVVIPVYNGGETIARAIDSALAQSFGGECEVIVVNDGSTDTTAQVLAAYGTAVRIIDQPNHGLAAARNAGIAVAGGEYVAFLDADDVWMAHKLAATVDLLERTPQAVLAYSDATPVDAAGHVMGNSHIAPEFARAPSMDDLLAQYWPILPSAVVMRRAVVQACGGFCEDFHRAYEDVDLWLRARELGEFVFVAESLLRYRVTAVAERMAKYEPDYEVFNRRVRLRYGARARNLLRAAGQAYVSTLGYQGLVAMRTGDMAAARRYFIRALRYQPANLKMALRLLKTFLPAPLARALSGRTGRIRTNPA